MKRIIRRTQPIGLETRDQTGPNGVEISHFHGRMREKWGERNFPVSSGLPAANCVPGNGGTRFLFGLYHLTTGRVGSGRGFGSDFYIS